MEQSEIKVLTVYRFLRGAERAVYGRENRVAVHTVKQDLQTVAIRQQLRTVLCSMMPRAVCEVVSEHSYMHHMAVPHLREASITCRRTKRMSTNRPQRVCCRCTANHTMPLHWWHNPRNSSSKGSNDSTSRITRVDSEQSRLFT